MKNSVILYCSVLMFCSSCKENTPTDDKIPEPIEDVFTDLSWHSLNSDVFSSTVTNGILTLSLDQNALWYHNSQGGLYYTLLSGDFTLSAIVKARKRSNPNESPDCEICLGGLMVRNPVTAEENYVHLVSGNTPDENLDGADELGYEHKSTTEGTSTFEAFPRTSSDHFLQICREGDTFHLSIADLSNLDNVTHVITYQRSDLPDEVQVGFNIYTAVMGDLADLQVSFENVELNRENTCN